MRFLALIIAGMLAVSIAPIFARAEKTPEFSDYKVAPVQYTESKFVDLTSHENARSYHTRLQEGFKAPADFAQKYVVVIFGCGSSCQVNWIINKETGKVLDVFGSTFGAGYKKGSALVIADPVPDRQPDMSEEHFRQYMQSYKGMVGGPRYYVVENDKLKLILDNSKANRNE